MSNAVTEGVSLMIQGRIVWTSGNLFTGKEKIDKNTNQPKLDKRGQPVREYGFGIAVPKNLIQNFWDLAHAEAFKIYTNGVLPPDFAMKFKDGDTDIDHNGKPFSEREGYKGALVLACTTYLPIKYCRLEGGQNLQIAEGIKCGDFIEVQLNVKAHPAINNGKAGLYLNPMFVRFLGYGEEIVNTPSGDAIFGTTLPSMPAGASATPIGNTGMIAPQAVGTPAPVVAAPAPVTPVAAPAHYGVLPEAHQPVAAPLPVVAPMPAVVAPAPASVPVFNPHAQLPQ